MKKLLSLIMLVAVALAFMGRPGPPPGHGGPQAAPHGPMCTACHEPKALTDLVRTNVPVTVSGYVVDQKYGFIVIMDKMNVYRVKASPFCGEVLGYRVTVRGVETLRGKGSTFVWHLVRALSCPSAPAERKPTESARPIKLVSVDRPECKACHPHLRLSEWKEVNYNTNAEVYVFYLNGTAVGVGNNAFWHLENCKAEVGWNEVSGTVVEEGSGVSSYKVLKCS